MAFRGTEKQTEGNKAPAGRWQSVINPRVRRGGVPNERAGRWVFGSSLHCVLSSPLIGKVISMVPHQCDSIRGQY